MEENKLSLVLLGFAGTLCLCLIVAVLLGAGFYLSDGFSIGDSAPAQATVPPENIPTRLPAMTPTGSAQPNDVPEELPGSVPERDEPTSLDALDHIAVLPFSYSDDDDEANEGVAIDLVFYDANEEVITFTGTPVEISMEFYAFTDFFNMTDLSQGDLIYTETVTRDHSSTLEEMFVNYIRVPYEALNVDPQKYTQLGAVRVTVDAPSGVFEDVSTLVILYPEEE